MQEVIYLVFHPSAISSCFCFKSNLQLVTQFFAQSFFSPECMHMSLACVYAHSWGYSISKSKVYNVFFFFLLLSLTQYIKNYSESKTYRLLKCESLIFINQTFGGIETAEMIIQASTNDINQGGGPKLLLMESLLLWAFLV